MLDSVRSIIPALSNSLHKGNAGRIAVVGGSYEYCGAPYYAAESVLRVGADLSFIFCTAAAATPIKSYSPELIVLPCLDGDDNELKRAMERLPGMHSLVVGPGLGRDKKVFASATALIQRSMELRIPLVLDGDALFLLSTSSNLRDSIKGYSSLVLTPNKVEFSRLYASVFPNGNGQETSKSMNASQLLNHPSIQAAKDEKGTGLLLSESETEVALKEPTHPAHYIIRLARAFGSVTILQKGAVDIISDGKYVAANAAFGSPRRCGGQGDVLAGTTGVFLNWALSTGVNEDISPAVVAAYGASVLTRRANSMAFTKHKRSMVTPDMIQEIGEAFEELYPMDSCSASL
eukprot:CAMPEP_0204836250 /NCGR_PEP_ID=MMETSP1346-20131115/24590_1 /ASSEMBLY_ACC=CAM_ASM_000771 /TAXON_ID=215587 /ORGANISM="Aplanochytrium stocchinoi, Strain GSBS06" /LENGTH=346 /DNA_ID=CAMNT_0051970809 /DNA_START=93 /DNA_END=1133 /DNA_ORIENTATION=-